MISYEEAREKLAEYQNRTGMPQVAIARELGFKSGSLVSDFLNGKYKAPHMVIPKVEELVRYKEEKELSPQAPDFADTTIAKRIMNTIKNCQIQGKLGCIFGDAGVGKTTSIKQYCKENSLAVMLTMSPAFASVAGFNEKLSEQINIKERSSRHFYAKAVNRLSSSGMVVIIDEAQHMTNNTIEHIRCMCDESGAGFVLVGNEMVYKRIDGDGRPEFAQWRSRLGGEPLHLMVNQFKREDILSIFEPYKVPQESIEILYKISKTYVGLRGAVNVYVQTIAAFKNAEPKNIAAMAKAMRIA